MVRLCGWLMGGLLLLGGVVGCGAAKPAGSPSTVARAWAAAQRDGQFARACRLTSKSDVETLGGLQGCRRFYARRLLGGEVRVVAATPRNLYPVHSFAVITGKGGWTDYNIAQVVVESGQYRVQEPTTMLTATLRYAAHPNTRIYHFKAKPLRH